MPCHAMQARTECHRYTPAQPEYGFTTFMSLATLMDPSKGYLAADGTVTIRAAVRLVEDL